jgi:hypothetical protein
VRRGREGVHTLKEVDKLSESGLPACASLWARRGGLDDERIPFPFLLSGLCGLVDCRQALPEEDCEDRHGVRRGTAGERLGGSECDTSVTLSAGLPEIEGHHLESGREQL